MTEASGDSLQPKLRRLSDGAVNIDYVNKKSENTTPKSPPSLSALNKALNDLSDQFEAGRKERLASAPVVTELSQAKRNRASPKSSELKLGSNGTNASEPTEAPQRSATPPPRRLPPLDPAKKKNASPRLRRLSDKDDLGNKVRDGRIKVVVRKRPFMPGEGGVDSAVVEADTVTLTITKQRIDLTEYTEKMTFNFDNVFEADSHNQDVFDACALELLDVAIAGGSASCFAYGQTGSGKTHTMMGKETESGLYAIAAEALFKKISKEQKLRVSFYEIYCNSLYDLLNSKYPVVLREDYNRKMNICGLTWHELNSVEDLLTIVGSGLEQRTTANNSVNEHSSRSHAVMCIQVLSNSSDAVGTLNFVDLAGSERAADVSCNDKQTRMEGAEINKSLLALKECIRALDEKKKHIPFRGSKLTEVLRDSFTGNSKTVMIANISPSSLNFDHTANTLRYAFRVKGLSVASIIPSKERNAPRPFQLGVRARSAAPDSLQKGSESPSKRSRSAAKRANSPQRASEGESRRSKQAALEEESISLPLGGANMFPSKETAKPYSAGREVQLPCICTEDSIKRFELEIKRKVMMQVQNDLGHEIQQVLDQRDTMISELQEENQRLHDRIRQLESQKEY